MTNKKNNNVISKSIKYITTALLLLIPQIVFATSLFEYPDSDKAIAILSDIFGGLLSGSNDPLVSAIAVFNGAVLTLGGVLATYTILSGTLGTAHDGEMLGKKFSSVWIPIRYSIGTALLLPIVGGGYNLIQVIVMWLVSQSVGLADITWNKFVEGENIAKITVSSIQNPEAVQLGYSVFQSLVCMAGVNKTLNDNPILNGGSDIGIKFEYGSNKTIYSFGDKNHNSGLNIDSCGKVEITKNDVVFKANDMKMDLSKSAEFSNNLYLTQIAQFNLMINKLQPIANKMIDDKKEADNSQIENAITTYEDNIKTKAVEALTNMKAFDEISKNAQKDGFITAGFFYIKLAYLTDSIQRGLNNLPTATGVGEINSLLGEEYSRTFTALTATIDKSKSNLNYGISNESDNTSWYGSIKNAIKNLDPSVIVRKAFTSSTNFAIQDGEHPLMAMKRLGNWCLALAGGGWASAMIAITTIGNAPGVGMALTTSMMLILIPLTAVGFTLSYVLPMLPALIWLGVVVGWLVLVIEAVFSCTIWIVMHLSPHGDDLTGSGATGYKLLMSLLFRPVLMVFGLMASIVLIELVGGLINTIFTDIFLISQQDSSTFIYLVGLIAAPIIYCFIQYLTITKIFGLIHIIPDEMAKWVGMSHHSSSNYANTAGGNGGIQNIGIVGASIGNNIAKNGMKDKGDSAGLPPEKKIPTEEKNINNGGSPTTEKPKDIDNEKISFSEIRAIKDK